MWRGKNYMWSEIWHMGGIRNICLSIYRGFLDDSPRIFDDSPSSNATRFIHSCHRSTARATKWSTSAPIRFHYWLQPALRLRRLGCGLIVPYLLWTNPRIKSSTMFNNVQVCSNMFNSIMFDHFSPVVWAFPWLESDCMLEQLETCGRWRNRFPPGDQAVQSLCSGQRNPLDI